MTAGIGPLPADADTELFPGTAPVRVLPNDNMPPSTAAACAHCGAPAPSGAGLAPTFCCSGCEAAYAMVAGLGLDAYYRKRSIDPEQPPLRPDAEPSVLDFDNWMQRQR